jgi:hypothetical protein
MLLPLVTPSLVMRPNLKWKSLNRKSGACARATFGSARGGCATKTEGRKFGICRHQLLWVAKLIASQKTYCDMQQILVKDYW